jgi:hypothetical protein
MLFVFLIINNEKALTETGMFPNGLFVQLDTTETYWLTAVSDALTGFYSVPT